MDINKYAKTVFCDIDGVLFKHFYNIEEIHSSSPAPLLGVVDAFNDWNRKGHRVILTTGRPESMRSTTVRQIIEAGLYYHELIMGLPRGSRVLINDAKPDSSKTAFSFSIARDEGLIGVDI